MRNLSSSSVILGYIANLLQTMVHHILTYPLTDMKFLVPVLAVVVTSVYVRHLSVKQKVDSPPSLKPKRERFRLPNDRFNREVGTIMAEQYAGYINSMKKDFESVGELQRRFSRAARMYSKYNSMLKSPSKKRREKAEIRRREILRELIEIYSDLKRISLSVITLDEEVD